MTHQAAESARKHELRRDHPGKNCSEDYCTPEHLNAWGTRGDGIPVEIISHTWVLHIANAWPAWAVTSTVTLALEIKG